MGRRLKTAKPPGLVWVVNVETLMEFLHFGHKTTDMSILDMIGSDMGNFIISEPYNPYDRTANLGVKMALGQKDSPAAYSETKVIG